MLLCLTQPRVVVPRLAVLQLGQDDGVLVRVRRGDARELANLVREDRDIKDC